MEKRPTEIKGLKPGGFVLIDDVPCVVEKVQTSKAGKHGAAKARLFARGIFDDVKKIIVKPADARLDVPVIEKRSAQVISKSESYVQIMDMEDFAITEIKKPEFELNEGDEVLVWRFGSYAMIKQKK